MAQVSDEEALGFKAINSLAGVCQLRIFPQPEFCHRTWNDYTLALEKAGLKSTLFKGTLLSNWCLGPFDSGTHHSKLVDAAEHLLDSCSTEFLEEMGEAVALDRGEAVHELTREEWLTVCTKRIPKVLELVIVISFELCFYNFSLMTCQ